MKDYKKQLHQLLNILQRYSAIIAIVLFAVLCGVIIWISSQQAVREPSTGAVLDQISSSSRLKLDDEAAQTLIDLEDSNIEVKALFEESRNNPFTE
jgi:hypothetical protein